MNHPTQVRTNLLKAAPVVEQKAALLRNRVAEFKERGITPCLAVILVGDEGPSARYVSHKKKKCEELGAKFVLIHLENDITPEQFVEKVDETVQSPEIHGALIQLPLPPQLRTLPIHRLVPPEKDVDGFHPLNAFELYAGHIDPLSLVPCTPKGVLSLLDFYGHKLEGKRCLVLGRSLIVGRPLSQLLLQQHATVTMAHSRSVDLDGSFLESDFIFSAMGRPSQLTPSQFSTTKPQVLIDIGTTMKNGKLSGDLNAEEFSKLSETTKLSWTPVPGGVGPMTVISLMENLLIAVERNERKMEQLF